ncbi:MAG TPA: polysaccharide biosynthesis/export family protein [Candidatus Sulfotelmatobacter sp.]|nr:polysaccharide biosynthesis/export family protein [Candidatus Sulfotelmatobacter sp.]
MNRAHTKFAAAVLGLTLAACLPGLSFGKQDDNAKSDANMPVEDYKLGPADVVVVSVPDAPEFGGKFRVSDSGTIDVPGSGEPIHAEGLTTAELAHAIAKALVEAKQLRDPRISVFVDEYHGRTVTVLGAVAKPAVYPLTKRTNVLEAISMAGGTLPASGNTITIVRGEASAEATNTVPGSTTVVRISDLVKGKDLANQIEIRNGDVITVSSAEVVYVVGAVIKPGGYAMPDPGAGVSVVQAVALAQGLTGVASSHAVVVRQSTQQVRQEIPVDLRQMMAGKIGDVSLVPNDILYVPASGTRQTLKYLGEMAMNAVNGAAFYGIGYRIAGIP